MTAFRYSPQMVRNVRRWAGGMLEKGAIDWGKVAQMSTHGDIPLAKYLAEKEGLIPAEKPPEPPKRGPGRPRKPQQEEIPA